MNNLKKYIGHTINTPWKLVFELRQIMVTQLVLIYLRLLNVGIDKGAKFYGKCTVFKHRNSTIVIGKNFENRNWWNSNPLGITHPTIITTWAENARISIGNNVGISGGSICAQVSITIGDNCLIGANTVIIDTDFHPLATKSRRYSKKSIKAKSIEIKENVFVGMNCVILKGVIIGKNSIVGAGSVVRSNIPENTIYSDGKMTKIKYEN